MGRSPRNGLVTDSEFGRLVRQCDAAAVMLQGFDGAIEHMVFRCLHALDESEERSQLVLTLSKVQAAARESLEQVVSSYERMLDRSHPSRPF